MFRFKAGDQVRKTNGYLLRGERDRIYMVTRVYYSPFYGREMLVVEGDVILRPDHVERENSCLNF